MDGTDISRAVVDRIVAAARASDSTEAEGLRREIVRAVEDSLATSRVEAFARQVVEAAPDPIVTLDDRGCITSFNHAAERTFGFDACEIIGREIDAIVAPGDRERHRDFLHPTEEGTSIQAAPDERREMTAVRQDGTTFPVEVAVGEPPPHLSVDGRRTRVSIWRDITKRRESEAARARWEARAQRLTKLESLGVLAGGIAHDFNNLLVSILGNAGLVASELERTSPILEYVTDIETAGQRAAALTRELLAYSGKGAFMVDTIDLSALIEALRALPELPGAPAVEIAYHLDPKLPLVEADSAQLRQVIVHLLTNAVEALDPHGGKVSVSTSVLDCDEAYLHETFPLMGRSN